MSILAEMIQKIVDLANKGYSRSVVEFPNDPDKRIVLHASGHEVIQTPRVAPDRRHSVATIDSFVAAYKKFGVTSVTAYTENATEADYETGKLRSNPIWINDSQALFYADEPMRRSIINLPVLWSEQWAAISTFENAQALDQATFVRLLRHDLEGCVSAGVLAAYRTLNFQMMETAARNLQNQSQSMDAGVIATVKGDDKPEGFIAEIRPFALSELRTFTVSVKFTIDIIVKQQKLMVQLLPDELSHARQLAQQELARIINYSLPDVQTLFGTP